MTVAQVWFRVGRAGHPDAIRARIGPIALSKSASGMW
jgi:hypothetical protein